MSCVELNPRNEDDMRLAGVLLPWTIHAEGIAADQSIPFSVSDTGTSAAFDLTVDEHRTLVELLTAGGVDPGHLEVLPTRRKLFS